MSVSDVKTPTFAGNLEITVYNGSPLFNVAAVMATEIDSTAYLYDAGLVTTQPVWNSIAWSDTTNQIQSVPADLNNLTSAGGKIPYHYRYQYQRESGRLSRHPHQYFYPLDEAFNLDFTWYGTNYRSLVPAFGIGIRQDLKGDNRWVPWVNAPPKRGNGLILLSDQYRCTR